MTQSRCLTIRSLFNWWFYKSTEFSMVCALIVIDIVITVDKMVWTHKVQISESETNLEHNSFFCHNSSHKIMFLSVTKIMIHWLKPCCLFTHWRRQIGQSNCDSTLLPIVVKIFLILIIFTFDPRIILWRGKLDAVHIKGLAG